MLHGRLSGAAALRPAAIDPASVAFDVDGVIADTMALFLDIARDEFDVRGVRYEDITCYNVVDCLAMDPDVVDRILLRILDGTYTHPLRPIPGAAGVLRRLARRSALLLVTARPQVGPVGAWIDALLAADAATVEIVATGSFEAKTEVLLDRGVAHFVEDRLETCFTLADAGVHPVLFAQPWNRRPHPFLEVSSWEELDALIQW
ncbi:MAG: haloacid dehalogenase [Desulfobacteraceae bacterium]|nr:MAG: haloacid dehalogenase [Desulfobacteraceae bacterium]